MSERRKELITEGNAKKQAISVILVAILLIGLYFGSTALFGFIFGTRTTPSDELTNASEEEAELFEIAFDMFDLMDLLNYEDLLEHAEEAVFYIENYTYFDESWLWKFSVMDEYNNDGSWSQSVSGLSPTEFTYWHEYWEHYSDRDIIRIKYPIDATAGENSLVIPTLFPTPHIIERPWIDPWDWDAGFEDHSTILYKDIFNVASVNLNFNSDYSGNLTYDLFSESVMSPTELNNSAVMEIYTPNAIKDQYYQLPDSGGIPGYILNNPNFKSHYDALDVIIDSTDNAYVKANKIRNYLQENFDVDVLPPYNRPAQGQDVVEWFCGEQSGIFSDFAATFTAFARAFGIASRYVDGFNSRKFPIYPSEHYNAQEDKNYSIIRRINLYSWSEIYVPLAIDGSGVWTEMDILFEGQNPLTFEEMELIVYTNTTSPVIRGDSVEITAELFSSGNPQEGITITFEDVSENNPDLPQGITDNNGKCSIIINIDDQTVAGPHLIQASSGFTVNYTIYFLNAPIEVNLTDVDPTTIDKTVSSNTRIMGVLFDPANGKGVPDGEVEFLLLDSLNNKAPFAFTPDFEITNNDGDYNTSVYVNDHVVSGTYDVRVDFNGSFHVESLSGVFSPFYSYPLLNDSSSEISVQIINPDATFLDLYIDGYPYDDFSNPRVNRDTSVELRVVLYSLSGPLQGRTINFYDITENPSGSPIHTEDTASNGEISFYYYLNFDKIAGPHLICAEWGTLKNYSYFILDDNIRIDLNPPRPVPNIINRIDVGDYTFNIKGSILDDTNNNPIKHAEITVYLIRNNIEYFMELQPLNPSTNPYYCGIDGTFDLNFDVDNNINPGNYSIRVDFNGTFYYLSQDYDYPHDFFLTYINTSSATIIDLKIETPDIQILDFWINGTSTSEYEQPIVKRTQELNLKVNLQGGSGPLEGELVRFFDETNNSEIGVKTTDENGYANITYYLNTGNLLAGPHLIYAEWGSLRNHSYFTMDEAIRIDLNPPKPVPNIINRSGSVGTIFNINGSIIDDFYNRPIKYAEITVNLIRNNIKYNTQLIPIYPSTNPYYCGADGIFDLYFDVIDSINTGNYSIRIDFNGTFDYSWHPFSSYPNHPNPFNLDYINTSTSTIIDLEIKDPYNITIEFWIDGNETLSTYDNFNPPQSFNRNDDVNFTVKVMCGEDPVINGVVFLYDVYENRLLNYSQTDINGYVEFISKINDSWVVGPHKIKVLYQLDGYDFLNYTFIILNGSKNVEISVVKNDVVIRNIDWINVSGSVKDTYNSIKMKQVEVTIKLVNNSNDYSNYLIFQDGYYPSMIISQNTNWDYTFIFKVNISIPYGKYDIRVDFNGTIIDYPDPYCSINLNNYMISNSSELKLLNIFATVTIDGNYHTDVEGEWHDGDIIQIYGTMRYDNGSAVKYKQVNCTLEDSIGTVYDWNDTEQTNEFGYFYIEIEFQYIYENPEKVFAISLINQNFIIDIRVELQWE